MYIYSRRPIRILCVSIVLFTCDAVASDDYMKLLEAEADGTELDPGGQSKTNTTVHRAPVNVDRRDWQGECDYVNDVLALGVVWEEFASHLKQCSLGTYVFYRRLDLDSQRLVYINNYSKNAPTKLSILKKAIFKYF